MKYHPNIMVLLNGTSSLFSTVEEVVGISGLEPLTSTMSR